ncbi:MAG: metallophosphoesterase [Candidatus Taylorbacteria bacterium]|nr:metallophosphoesterase [Candidatus Taylorbacteria bacterium]
MSLFLSAVFLFELFILVGHVIIYKSIISAFEIVDKKRKKLFAIIIFLFGILFTFSTFIANSGYSAFGTVLYKTSAILLGVTYIISVFSFLFLLIKWIIKKVRRDIVFQNMKVGVTFLILALIISFYSYIQADTVLITKFNTTIPNLPEVWKGKKAVWVSDIHLGLIRDVSKANEVVDKIKSESPDIVFIGGDLFDGLPANDAELIAPFSTLKPSLGVYYIRGNHDESRSINRYDALIKSAGIKILSDQAVIIKGLRIIGVGYQTTNSTADFSAVLNNVLGSTTNTIPTILLKHSPKDLDVSSKFKIDLQISGHSHAGQIFPGNLMTYLQYGKYDYGLQSKGTMAEYTSSGAGTWGPPFRFGTQSEIVSITLH